ncbi:hypothetical protein JL722_3672 [Aureococcus anophagefferens]|nr:hypothetical protein JL722_3672 [Aureococcus anophagefferens]
MPIRHGGGGLRLRVGVADAAFFGAGCAVLPTMVDRAVGGSTVAGFMTQLEPELGQGSFDEGASGQFAGLEAAAGSGCSTAVEMLTAWDSTVAAVAEEEDHEGLPRSPRRRGPPRARVSYDREVLGVFADLVPADEATSFFEKHAGKGEKAGIVPHFKLVPGDRAAQLADVKTIGFAKSRYGRTAARREARQEFYPDEAAGSFERRLGSFGSVVGLVAGYFGELNKGAHCVRPWPPGCGRTWIEAGATSLDHAKSIQKQRLYREWGVASVRAVARIKIGAPPSSAPVVDPAARLRPGRGREGPRRGLRPRGPRHRRDLRRPYEQ